MATTLFNNLITFSRGTNATLVGANGLVQYAPSNLLLQSQTFDNASWTKVNATVTANSTTAPDGTTTADLVTVTGASGRALESTVFTAAAQTFSVYLKASSTTDTLLRIVDVTPTTSTLTLSWSGGVPSFVSNTGSGYAIQSVGNGWYRVSIAATTAAGSGSVQVYANGSNSSGATLLWGAQLELGTAATTYNSTTVKNLLGYSEAFDNAAWGKTNVSAVAGAQANPLNGLFTAQKLMENTAAATRNINQNATTTANPWTFSVYAKAAERNWIAIGFNDSSNTLQLTFLNLATGAVGNLGTGASASTTPVGSGWYRCSVTMPAFAGSNFARIYLASANGTISYTGDGNSGVYIYGAQLSDSGSLDPYVPTPGAAPTSAAYYGPRFDYDPVTLAAKGLLIEEARTNLATYSEDFTNAAWGVSGLTVTANTTTAPSGATAADTITGSTGTNAVLFSVAGFAASATSYTASCYVKAGSAAWLVLSLWAGSGTNGVNVWFNAQTGAVGSNNATAGYVFTSASSTAVGNGWYRITVTGTVPAVTIYWSLRMVDGDNAFNYTNTIGDTVNIWGAQLEAGAFATSYIPTVASTVTRSADVATITGSLFSGWYNGAQGTFVVGLDTNATLGAPGSIGVDAGSTTNSYIIRSEPSSNTVRAIIYSGGVSQFNNTAAGFSASGSEIAFAYSNGNIALVSNGGSVLSGAPSSLPISVNQFRIGADATSSYLNGHIRSITYLPVRNADYQIQGFTA